MILLTVVCIPVLSHSLLNHSISILLTQILWIIYIELYLNHIPVCYFVNPCLKHIIFDSVENCGTNRALIFFGCFSDFRWWKCLLLFFLLPCSFFLYLIQKWGTFFTYNILLFFHESALPITLLSPERWLNWINSDGWFHETALSTKYIW